MSATALTYQTPIAKNRADLQQTFRYLTSQTRPPQPLCLNPVVPARLLQKPAAQTRPGRKLASTRPGNTRRTKPGNTQRPVSPALSMLHHEPYTDPAMPDPRRWAAQIARASLEAIERERPLTQLTRWLTPQQYRLLEQRRHARPHTAPGGRTQAHQTRLRPVTVLSARCRPTLDGAQEATVILHDGFRGRATALRLEKQGEHWIVTSLKLG